MALISLDLNQARQTAGTFSLSGNSVDDLCGQLQRQWSSLSSTWEGDSKYDVASEVNAVLNRGQHCAEFTCERGTKLTQIVDRFQAADDNEPFLVESITWSFFAGLAAGGFNWISIPNNVNSIIGGLPDLLAKNLTYDEWRSIGRFINANVLKNLKGGWVGRMDDIGHLVEGKWGQIGIPLATTVFGVFMDEDFGTNTGRAIAGEVFVWGATTVATRLIPGVGWVMLGSDIVQLGGNLLAGGLQSIGLSEEAVWIQNTLDKIDLGGYVEEIGEGIYDTASDWVTNPDHFILDVESAVDVLGDFGCGLIEGADDLVGHAADFFGGLFD